MELEHPTEAEATESTKNRRQSDSGNGQGMVEASGGISTTAPFPIRATMRAVFAASVPLAALLAVLSILLGRSIDLPEFLLALCAAFIAVIVIWRLHKLYLVLDRYGRERRGLPAAEGSDPLSRLATHPLWDDAFFRQLLAGALTSNLALFAYVSDKYASLPPFLPLHYSATGDVDRLGTPIEVFMMPAIGVVVLLTNMVLATMLYRRERLASQMLMGASIFVQLVLLVATTRIVSQA